MAIVVPRVGEIIFPILRTDFPNAQIVSWLPPLEDRSYPLILVQRTGGNSVHPELADRPTLNIQSWHRGSPAESEQLALEIRASLWQAWKEQRVIDSKGCIGNLSENNGPALIGDPGEKAWRYQQAYRVIIRPATD